MSDWDDLVEATMDAIRVDTSRKEISIEVTYASNCKERKRILATGVDDFVANEMRLSNIIDRVTRFGAHDVTSAEVSSRLFYLMRGREPSSSDLEWPILKQKMALISDGKLSLLEIEPVYGATVTILAEAFRIDPIDSSSSTSLPNSSPAR